MSKHKTPRISHFHNPFDKSQRTTWQVQKGITINQLLRDSGLDQLMRIRPIVLMLNGDEILEKDYDKKLEERDVLVVMELPEEAVTIAAMIKIATIVFYVVATAAIIYTLVNQPDIPDSAEIQDGSPTYSIRSRGNRARMGSPKPVVYGTFRTWPDLSAVPFSEFENENDMVLYQLFEVSQGECVIDVASMRFEDTNLANFEDYEVEVLQPGDESTIYPSAVILSTEVANLELTDTNPVGPYSASNVGEETTRLSVDMMAPGGLYEQDEDDGDLKALAVSFDIEARDLDGGSWFLLGSERLSGYNRDPKRRTYTYTVDAARYEVRVTRLADKSTSLYISDQLNWGQLKGFLKDETGITTTTRVGLKIRASEQLGNRALSKFNLICQHKIQTWNNATGWSVPLLTSNPAWVFADVLRSQYGGSRGDQFINLLGLEALAASYDADGIEFNGVFDTKGTVWDALKHVASAGFASPVDRAGVIHMIRDVYDANSTAMFTNRNIVRDSFSVEHIGILTETSNAVKVEYYDKTEDYRQADVLCALDGSPGDVTKTIRYFGVTDRDQAFNLGMYLTAQNHYRRERVTFETGIEGYIPMFGDVVSVSSYVLGQEGATQTSGDIRAFDGVDVVTLVEDIEGLFTSPFIIIRDLLGEPTAPLQCTVIDGFNVRIIDSFDTSILVFESGYERPHFMIGEGVDYNAIIKINKIQPRGDNRVLIEGFVDAPEVYSAADGLPIPPIALMPGQIQIYPVVDNLTYGLGGNTVNPIVSLAWDGSNADYFIIQFSDDGGNSWFEVGRSVGNGFVHYPVAGVVQYRVAGVNLFRSVWVAITVDTSEVEFAVPPDITNLALSESFTGPTLKIQWDSTVQDHQVIFSVASVQKYSDIITGKTYELTPRDELGRAFDVEVFAVAPNNKIATGSPKLSVSNPAPAVLNNLTVTSLYGNAKIGFDWPAGTDIAGISVWTSISSGFTPGVATLTVDRSQDPVIGIPVAETETIYIKVAAVDVWGDSGLNYSGEFTASGRGVDLSEIEEDLQQVKDDLDVVEADMVTVKADIVTVESDLDTAEATLVTVQADLDAAEATLVTVESDLTTIENKFPITTVDITDNAITAPKIIANAVLSDKIIANAITAGKIATNAVTADKIIANAITAGKIATNAVTADKIIASAITADKIAALAVTTAKLAALAVSADKIAANAISADKIAALAVVAGKIGALAVEAGTIAANAVTATEINVGNLSAISADMGTLSAGTMKTTTGTGLRTEISSSGSYPLWIGAGATKDDANGRFYIKSDGSMVLKDAAGVVIIASGPIAVDYATSIDNANQDWQDVSGTGIPADNADVTADNAQSPSWLSSPVVWSGNKIASGNIGTYMSSAAIGTAYIANAAITNALIGDLAVNTIKLQGQSVVIAEMYFSATQVNLVKATYVQVATKSITMTDAISSSAIIITSIFEVFVSLTQSSTAKGIYIRIKRGSTVLRTDTVITLGPGSQGRQVIPVTYNDSPGAGTFTYSIEVNGYSTFFNSGYCINRSLLLQGGKK